MKELRDIEEFETGNTEFKIGGVSQGNTQDFLLEATGKRFVSHINNLNEAVRELQELEMNRSIKILDESISEKTYTLSEIQGLYNIWTEVASPEFPEWLEKQS